MRQEKSDLVRKRVEAARERQNWARDPDLLVEVILAEMDYRRPGETVYVVKSMPSHTDATRKGGGSIQ